MLGSLKTKSLLGFGDPNTNQGGKKASLEGEISTNASKTLLITANSLKLVRDPRVLHQTGGAASSAKNRGGGLEVPLPKRGIRPPEVPCCGHIENSRQIVSAPMWVTSGGG